MFETNKHIFVCSIFTVVIGCIVILCGYNAGKIEEIDLTGTTVKEAIVEINDVNLFMKENNYEL